MFPPPREKKSAPVEWCSKPDSGFPYPYSMGHINGALMISHERSRLNFGESICEHPEHVIRKEVLQAEICNDYGRLADK